MIGGFCTAERVLRGAALIVLTLLLLYRRHNSVLVSVDSLLIRSC